MAFWKKLFGGTESQPTAESVQIEGYTVTPASVAEGSQFRLAAMISKEIDGATKTHHLIRADLFMSAQEANDAALRKARQVIAEQGDAMFNDQR